MTAVFLKLLNMSINASWIVLAVMLIRSLFKRSPKTLLCSLWTIVGIRLVCPVSFESVLSLIPSKETVPPEIVYAPELGVSSGFDFVDNAVNPMISQNFAPTVESSVNSIQIILFVMSVVWITGVAMMFGYATVSYLMLKRRVRTFLPCGAGVRECEGISSPFILGLFSPFIYIPIGIGEKERECILAHERAHIKRRDHWWKPLGYVLLSVYWFNPIMWIGYILLCRDIELACDEKVIKDMGAEDKKTYTSVLLDFSVSRAVITACPLAFGEVGVKGRVKNVLSYKKPALWIVVCVCVAAAVIAICFLTDPEKHSYSDITADLGTLGGQNITGTKTPDPPINFSIDNAEQTNDGVEEFFEAYQASSLRVDGREKEDCVNITPNGFEAMSGAKIFKFKETNECFLLINEGVFNVLPYKRYTNDNPFDPTYTLVYNTISLFDYDGNGRYDVLYESGESLRPTSGVNSYSLWCLNLIDLDAMREFRVAYKSNRASLVLWGVYDLWWFDQPDQTFEYDIDEDGKTETVCLIRKYVPSIVRGEKNSYGYEYKANCAVCVSAWADGKLKYITSFGEYDVSVSLEMVDGTLKLKKEDAEKILCYDIKAVGTKISLANKRVMNK